MSSTSTSIPPWRLALIGIVYIASLVNLVVPPILFPSFLHGWIPKTFVGNDVMDGLVFVIISCFLHRSNLPRGITGTMFVCFCLKLIGAGAHMVANSSDRVHGFDLRDSIGKRNQEKKTQHFFNSRFVQ